MGWLGSLELDHGQLCFSELDRGWLGFPELDRRLGFPELDHGLGDGGHKKTTQTTTIVLSKHEKQRAGTLPAQVQDASPRTAFVMPSVTKKRPSAARTFLSQALTSDRPEPLVPLMASSHGDTSQKMRPRPARHGDLPPDVQHRRLPRFVRGSVEALTDNMLQAIAQGLPEDGKLTFGTACSGSEFYLTSLPLVASCLSEKLGRPITFVHKWSCEIDPAKRQWILDNFAPPKLFADVTKLASGPCRDFVSGSDQEVDDVDIIIAGTSCKDASRLNPHHANRLNAVDSASHTTGSTFQGLAALVANMGLRCRLFFWKTSLLCGMWTRQLAGQIWTASPTHCAAWGSTSFALSSVLRIWGCQWRDPACIWRGFGVPPRVRPRGKHVILWKRSAAMRRNMPWTQCCSRNGSLMT